MVQDAEQIEKPLEDFDELDEKVDKNNRAVEMRSKINALLGRFGENKLATSKTIDAYRKAAEEDPTTEGLQGFYQWVGEQWMKANFALNNLRIKIDSGIQEKFISEKDREFLMDNLILTDEHDFVGKIEKISEVLNGKINRMKDDRKEYDKLADHPLVKNTGFLKPDKNTKIIIPDEKGFLAMTVPERRKLLEDAKKALPDAETYAKSQDGIESTKLGKEYGEILDNARKEGWIGKATYEKFMDGFKKIDIDEKKVWIQEMKNGNQLKRYKDLWTNIRKTLKGPALDKMESLRDQTGYTQLFTEFGKLKEQESVKLTKDYDEKLEQAYSQKIISKHTKSTFAKDIGNQDLDGKRKYMESFENQMQRYRLLRSQIDQMKDKNVKDHLNKMYESEKFGFTEIRAEYIRINNQGGKLKSADESSKSNPLTEVADVSIRRGIIRANELLKEKGPDKQRSFLNRIKTMISGEQSNEFNSKGFQANLRKMREEKNEKRKSEGNRSKIDGFVSDNFGIISMQNRLMKKRMGAELAGQNDKTEIQRRDAKKLDKNSVEKELKIAGADEKTHIVKDEGFTQVETTQENSQSQRSAIVEINRVKGLEHWDRENLKKAYRGKQYGGKDKVSFAIKTEDGRTVELNLQQIRAMEKFIKADMQNAEDEEKTL